jgi:hypothetical protein
VVFDESWPATPITGIDLADLADPSAAFLEFDLPACPNAHTGLAIALASTDPDGSGSISSAEIIAGFGDRSAYGVVQEDIIIWTDIGCPASPDIPEGLLPGAHVYTRTTPVMRLDGSPIPFTTCAPGSDACAGLDPPL